MAERRPIVLVNGELQELPSGDTLPGSGGASAFTALSDTPADFTGQALKAIRVNSGETALEFTDFPSGGSGGQLTAMFIDAQPSVTGWSTAVSATNAATKGNRVRVQYDIDLKTVTFQGNNTSSQTYECVVAEISGTTIGTIVGRVTQVSTGGADEFITFTFGTALRLVPAQDYAILITQQGGTGSTQLESHAGDGGMTGVLSSYDLGGYIIDNDIQGSETFVAFGSSYVGMECTYDIVLTVNGVGSGILSGTVDPTTEGNDGDFYYRTDTNTIFGPKNGTWPAGVSLVGPEGPVTTMVQTEITATAYSTVSADFAGNVVRRMNNAAAQTITVEPSMTGGQPVTFIATGAGAVSFVAGVGVTILSAGGNLTIADQYGSATLIPDANTAETYYLIGNLTT
ncbi:hypothetical protein vBDshPR2C_34 [Dinoroseobacter phage vBDshPR2C]|uniref:Uncharacterized protein n=1 Tax=Dinoroseobacter phage vBDshPR2C TaxID=1498169 RepID=A0A0A7CHH7_9CAUD|nr:hypothetical protein vBDshPR2C_34 [Dinoroseobacter phage vBDshPR2C]